MNAIATMRTALGRGAARAARIVARIGTRSQCACDLGGSLLRDVGLPAREARDRDGFLAGHMDRTL